MTQTIYTNYWISRIGDVRKKHGSYKSEEEAIEGIKAWWELHKERYPNAVFKRTNSGALEVIYHDEDSFYRIEKSAIEGKLPSRSYTLKRPGEIQAARSRLLLDDELFLFDELAEPFRDRLIVAMGDSKKARSYVYDREGRLVKEII